MYKFIHWICACVSLCVCMMYVHVLSVYSARATKNEKKAGIKGHVPVKCCNNGKCTVPYSQIKNIIIWIEASASCAECVARGVRKSYFYFILYYLMYTCMLKAAIVLFTTTEHAIHSNFIPPFSKRKPANSVSYRCSTHTYTLRFNAMCFVIIFKIAHNAKHIQHIHPIKIHVRCHTCVRVFNAYFFTSATVNSYTPKTSGKPNNEKIGSKKMKTKTTKNQWYRCLKIKAILVHFDASPIALFSIRAVFIFFLALVVNFCWKQKSNPIHSNPI